MMRLVKGSAISIPSPVFVGADGETPTDCTGTPTCTVTRDDGTALTAAVVTAAAGVGYYTAAITSTHTSALDVLSIVWTGTAGGYLQVYRSTVEIVGEHYVSIAELRSVSGLSDVIKFPSAELAEQRDALADTIDDWCQTTFTTRYRREQLRGDGSRHLLLDRWPCTSLRSVTVDGASVSTAEFDLDETGCLVWTEDVFDSPTYGDRNVVVVYEYGQPLPSDLRREAVRYLRWKCAQLAITAQAQAISETVDGRTVRYSTPDPAHGRPTGGIDLDAALVRLSHRVPGVA
jgi:hypothetical protein